MPEQSSLNPQEYFYLQDGKALRNIEELAAALRDMNEAIFKFHVTDAKNDFANWLRDVFGKQELAHKLRPLKTREHILKEIKKEMFRDKARKLLDLPTKYFNDKFKGKQKLASPNEASESRIALVNANPVEKEISKKLDQVLEKEREIEEQELLLKRKIDSQKKLSEHNFIHGMAVGVVVAAIVLVVYILTR